MRQNPAAAGPVSASRTRFGTNPMAQAPTIRAMKGRAR